MDMRCRICSQNSLNYNKAVSLAAMLATTCVSDYIGRLFLNRQLARRINI